MALAAAVSGNQIKATDLNQIINLLTGVMTDQPVTVANVPLAHPTAGPTVTPTGTAGTTAYSYAVVAVNALGDSLESPATQTTTGNATLSATNYNALSWAAVPGAASYKVIRTASAGTPATTGVIAAGVAGTTYNDQGAAASAYVAATADPGGGVIAKGFTVQGFGGSTNQFRLVGATTSGAPTTGTYQAGDAVVALDGFWWLCTAAGTPGTWKLAGAALDTNTPQAVTGAGSAGSSTNASHGDHVHPDTGLGVLASARSWSAAQTFAGGISVTGGTVSINVRALFGATTQVWDDGTYLNFATTSRNFYVQSSFGTTYIYSASIYLGDGSSANNIYARNAALTANYWNLPSQSGAITQAAWNGTAWQGTASQSAIAFNANNGNGSQARQLMTANSRTDANAVEGDILFNA